MVFFMRFPNDVKAIEEAGIVYTIVDQRQDYLNIIRGL